jgi:hypothetical protein
VKISKMSENDSSLTTQCLAFCQALASQGMAFTFSLAVGSTFNFSLDIKKDSLETKKETISAKKKKKKHSPSTLKRNFERRKKFLNKESEKEKLKAAMDQFDDADKATKDSEATASFNCDLCDYKGGSTISLRIHISRKHKDIPQVDGESSVSCRLSDRYWNEGKMSGTYQTYIDVLDDIKESTLDEEEQQIEVKRATEARKLAFGDDYYLYPPWS